MPIKYFLSIDTRNKADDKYEENVIKTALEIIENSTENLVQFKEVQNYENADLIIYGKPPEEDSDDRFITEGLAGPKEMSGDIIKKSRDNSLCFKTFFLYPRYKFFCERGLDLGK